MIELPTRENNILDLVFCSNPDVISNIMIVDSGLPSDHKSICFDFSLKAKLINSFSRETFDYKNANFDSLRDFLKAKPLKVPLGTDIDTAYSSWKSDFFSSINSFVPKRKSVAYRRAPWITRDIVHALKKKKTFWRTKVRGASDPKIFEAFRRLRQRIKNWIRASRKAYLNSISSNIFTNPRPFWSFFKSKSKSSSFPDTMFTDDKAAFSTDFDKAEAFSSFFCSIFTDHSCCSLSSSLVTLSSCSESAAILNTIILSFGEVLLELKRQKTSKSTGPDGLPARILVECATEIHSPVCELLNLSLSSGKFINAAGSRIITNLKLEIRDDVYCILYPVEYALPEKNESDSDSSTSEEEGA